MDGSRRVGKGEKGKDRREAGKVKEEMGGTGQDMGWGGEGKGGGRRGATAPKLQFLARGRRANSKIIFDSTHTFPTGSKMLIFGH